jgi:hypothetical protein
MSVTGKTNPIGNAFTLAGHPLFYKEAFEELAHTKLRYQEALGLLTDTLRRVEAPAEPIWDGEEWIPVLVLPYIDPDSLDVAVCQHQVQESWLEEADIRNPELIPMFLKTITEYGCFREDNNYNPDDEVNMILAEESLDVLKERQQLHLAMVTEGTPYVCPWKSLHLCPATEMIQSYEMRVTEEWAVTADSGPLKEEWELFAEWYEDSPSSPSHNPPVGQQYICIKGLIQELNKSPSKFSITFNQFMEELLDEGWCYTTALSHLTTRITKSRGLPQNGPTDALEKYSKSIHLPYVDPEDPLLLAFEEITNKTWITRHPRVRDGKWIPLLCYHLCKTEIGLAPNKDRGKFLLNIWQRIVAERTFALVISFETNLYDAWYQNETYDMEENSSNESQQISQEDTDNSSGSTDPSRHQVETDNE